MNIADYINESERLNNQIKHYQMELLTGVLTYKVLKNANVSNVKQQQIRATIVTLTYDNMKRQLKAIFDSSIISTDSESIDIKFEPVFYVNKGTMVDIKIQKIVVEMVPVNIQGITIDIVETCHTEVTSVDRNKILTSGGKKKSIRQIRKYFTLCHMSIYLPLG